MNKALTLFTGALALCVLTSAHAANAQAAAAPNTPERVTFQSADKKTTLVGYLFHPSSGRSASTPRMPAVVMMHGRSGVYSSEAKGVYTASTLSRRHKAWGALWAGRGYLALLVDGFGPRGYPGGFQRGTYATRPESLNEVTVRPLDAYGALIWLRARADVDGAHVGLQGWSNGGSATLATMATTHARPNGMKGFTAALALYPACGLKGAFESGYKPYARLLMFMGLADEEVSPKLCTTLVDASYAHGGNITLWTYDGATHDFDDPSPSRQRIAANAKATADAQKRAIAFFAQTLKAK